MTELVPFSYSGQQVRTLVDFDGNTWFVAADVCAVLGIRNVSDATRSLDADERSTIASTEGGPDRLIISEAGLYTLLIRSRRPEAKPFRRWVTHEVLPSIRRTGAYGATPVAEVVPAAPAPTGIDLLRAMVDQIATAHDASVLALATSTEAKDEARVANARLDAIEGRHDYYAALGWARLNGFAPTDDRTLANLGRIASTVGRSHGVLPGKAPHAHYGQVNTWPAHVWAEAAQRFQGVA